MNRLPKLSMVGLIFTIAFNSHAAKEDMSADLNIINIKKNLYAEMVVKSSIAPEAITVSESGQSIAFIARTTRDFSSQPPTTAWLTKKSHAGWSEPVELPISGMVTSIIFANRDQWLVTTTSHGTPKGYLTILKNLFKDREQIGNLEHFKHRIEVFDAKNPKKKLFSLKPSDFGLKKPEMLKHARISADGRLLTFYTHGYEDQKGIYLYNFETKQTVHLGLSDEKHPTFTPDGSKILFHQQSGGNSFNQNGSEVEKSVIGYYDLNQLDTAGIPRRVMMDSQPNQHSYIYHKHPAVYPGTDLLFFHAQKNPEGGKKIYVRRLSPDSQIYRLSDIFSGEKELKTLKHANSSINPTGLYFVGREEGSEKRELRVIDRYSEQERSIYVEDVKNIYHLPSEAIKFINERVK